MSTTDPSGADVTAAVVVTTTDTADEAERLARGLVEARLAACVQVVGPVRSAFRWEGSVSLETEWQLVVKTAATRVDELTAWIVGEHSYDVPEVIAVPVVGGHAPYLHWVAQETQRPEQHADRGSSTRDAGDVSTG